ncbi:lysoplasmalogenase [Acrocarpospora catenulata]|uniref:lysoplasmalogenase n=1 Tax=Acrocarpospora catenulata TaxID=2836182 RepID=UPI001BDB3D15|nr:lysoplasmalogenase [Acrocarpospora catenulata]
MEWVSKALLMPFLAGWVIARGGSRLLVAALFWSTLGDIGLQVDGLFLPGMVCFGLAHLCYVTMFLRSDIVRDWAVAGVYALVWLVLIVLLWHRLGELQVPIAGYSLLLTATAVTSLWRNATAGIGGGLFLLSDTLIAFRLAEIEILYGDLLVMSTYILAQYLLAAGSTRHVVAQPQT